MESIARRLNLGRAILAAGMLGLFVMASSALAANMLVFGDRAGDQASLTARLTALGHTVTNTTTLPVSLAGFAVVWQVQIGPALTAPEEARLTSFIQSGGSVYFTGERPCCDITNGSIQNILRGVVAGGGTIQVGNLGDIACPCTFNAAAPGGISTTPNTLTTWTPSASGGMANIAAANVFATGAGAVPIGAAYGPTDMIGGAGRAVVLMDVNYLSSDPDLANIIANISNFLLAGAGGGGPLLVPALTPWTLALLATLVLGAALWQRRRLS